MQISKTSLEKFKQIYREDYGITLSDAEALELATSFLNFMRVIARPLPTSNCTPPKSVLY